MQSLSLDERKQRSNLKLAAIESKSRNTEAINAVSKILPLMVKIMVIITITMATTFVVKLEWSGYSSSWIPGVSADTDINNVEVVQECDNPDVNPTSSTTTTTTMASTNEIEQNDQESQPTIRMISMEELAPMTGVDGGPVWLSIMGEVYDVTKGTDYYAPGKSYAGFPGRDASVPFCTGKFTPEEATKNPTDVLESKDLPGLADWRDFYRTHKVYTFVGRLIDPRYYNVDGTPTENMLTLAERVQVARVEQVQKAKLKREERAKRKQQKKK